MSRYSRLQRIAVFLGQAMAFVSGPLAVAEQPAEQVARITRKLEVGEPLVFATFGDSITYPCYHTDYRQNYITFTVDALRKRYLKSQIEIVHAGNMGTAERGLSDDRFERHVLAHKPDAVFIMFGMNDCCGGPAALEAYDVNLTNLIRKTRDAGAIPIIVTQNEIVYEGPEGQQRRALPQYMARALKVANRESVPVVDCFAAWKPLVGDRSKLAARLNDWIHPNHAGHRLLARAIVQDLWPDAANHVPTDEWTPPRPDEADAVDCLLPGPPGKQILHSVNGCWYCLTGRQRKGRMTDLVLSFCSAQRPRWTNFRRVTLVGADKRAVFDGMDRTLTSGMLLEDDGKIYVVFSWNVGVFMLSAKPLKVEPTPSVSSIAADESDARQEVRLSRPDSWLEDRTDPFLRPVIVANSIYGIDRAVLYDAYLQPNGWPAVLCWGRQLVAGQGFEAISGTDGIVWVTRPDRDRDEVRRLVLPHGRLACCFSAADGAVYYAAQSRPGEPLHVGSLPPNGSATTQRGVGQFLAPAGGARGIAMAEVQSKASESGANPQQWVQLTWDSGVRIATKKILDSRSRSVAAVPLPWWDGARGGIVWWEPEADSSAKPKFSYQARLARGACWMGVLTESKGSMCFSCIDLQ